jgi:hypothetical protein
LFPGVELNHLEAVKKNDYDLTTGNPKEYWDENY